MLELHTSTSLGGRMSLPARPPLPDGAVGYSDFITGLHVTDTQVSTLASTAIAMRPTNLGSGYVYGPDDVIPVGGNWNKLDYDHKGEPLGLRINSAFTQLLSVSHRQNIGAGAISGGTASIENPDADQPYQRWTRFTPSGAADASITLSTASVAAGSSVYFAVDVDGTGIVQIGSRADDAAWTNFDLNTGQMSAAPGVRAAMVRRRRGWTLAIIWVPAAALPDVTPYVASVADMDAERLSDGGQPFSARLARVVRPGGAQHVGYDIPPPAPSIETDAVSSSQLPQQGDLIADSAPFSTIFRLRSGWGSTQVNRGLFRFVISGTNGLELRFSSSNALVLWDRQAGALIHTFSGVSYLPESIYRVGVSRANNGTICVSVNGETATVSVPSVATAAPRWAGGLLTDSVWGGHIQTVILWPDAKPAQELAALCERHL